MINDIQIKNLCEDYINGGHLTPIAEKYGLKQADVKVILKENNIQIRKNRKRGEKIEFVIPDHRIKKYDKVEKGYHWVAVSKSDGTRFYDAENKGGFLTSYIKNTLGILVPPLFERNIYYKTTGNYWWEQYFDVVKEKDKETKKCPYCDWETVDIHNNSGAFLVHLEKTHGLTKVEYLKEHPEDRNYFILANKSLNRHIELDESKFVICAVCGEKFTKLTPKHLKTHGLTKDEYIAKYQKPTLSDDYLGYLTSAMKYRNEFCITPSFSSFAEDTIKEFLLKYEIEGRPDRHILNGKEIDVFIPSENIGIEYNGVRWHGEFFGKKDKDYHLNKTVEAKNNGVNLIQIYEDEYELHGENLLFKLLHIIGKENKLEAIKADACNIKEINQEEASKFINTYDIYDYKCSEINYGAFIDGNIISVISFNNISPKYFELTNISCDYRKNCNAVLRALFEYFLDQYKPSKIECKVDRRLVIEANNICTNLFGFRFSSYISPDYWLTNSHISKYKRFDKSYIENFGLDKYECNTEVLKSKGFDKIWDCGSILYIWGNSNVRKKPMTSQDKLNEFIRKAKLAHPNENLDYSKVEYKTNRTPVCIIDHDLDENAEEYGEFWQTPSNHLRGQSHPRKRTLKIRKQRQTDRDELIRRFKEAHPNDNFDFSKVEYINMHTPVLVIDHTLDALGNEYGEYYVEPNSFLKGLYSAERLKRDRANAAFLKIKEAEAKRKEREEKKRIKEEERLAKTVNKKETKSFYKGHKGTLEEFIINAKVVHPDENLDYSKATYVDEKTPICIIDHDLDKDGNEYGEYWQEPYAHMCGCGHPRKSWDRSSDLRRKNREQVIEEIKAAHPDEDLDFSKMEYINNKVPVTIIDHTLDGLGKEYGEYQVLVTSFTKKGSRAFAKVQRDAYVNFIKKAKEIHGDKDDYSEVEYASRTTPVKIICKEHGPYYQTINAHLAGCRCPKCANQKLTLTTDEFIKRATAIHKDKYDYSKSTYTKYGEPVIITCPVHGDFIQTPDKHLSGHGCPKCGNNLSKAEIEISDFLKSILGEDKIIERDRTVLEGRKELDIYIPEKNLAIEFNGLKWHSEEFDRNNTYHLSKTNECKEKGIRLIQIFEDEYRDHKNLVLNKLKHIIGGDIDCLVIGARKCEIREIEKEEAKLFLDEFHIQGFVSATVYLGAFDKKTNKLIAIMNCKEESSGNWNLSRFATDTSYKLPGIASKMLKHFINEYKPNEIKSFLDRRWNIEGNSMYEQIGFKLDKVSGPDYMYTDGTNRYHKFGFRKQTLNRKYGLPLSMTENEMTQYLGYHKVWNCGLVKYVWKKEKNV
jgi:hypothetical protein